MPEIRTKRYWLIGASDGIGAALAQELSALGAELILSGRRMDALQEVSRGLSMARCVDMDVSDSASVSRAAQSVGDVDGIIYMAGYYQPMDAAQWDTAQAERMIDVNLTGALRVLGHVVPTFLAKNSGHIVLIGSLASYRGLPGAIGYSASKAGLYSLAETLALDLHDTAVRVQVAHPGFVKTRLTDKNDFEMPFIQEPDQAAAQIVKLMRSRAFSRAFPAPFSWVFRLSRLLPDRLYIRLFSKRT